MPNRAQRRAAERRQQQQQLQSPQMPSQQQPPQQPSVASPSVISEAQLAANRANAQFSTGPRSETSKAKVSLNAVKTALTGQTVLLPSDDAELYRQHIAAYEKELQPVGIRERHLVQSIADTIWRLNRIPGLEAALYSKGRIDFADKFADRPEQERVSLIYLETLAVYEKRFRNLQLQDTRLARRRDKELADLERIQSERRMAAVRARMAAVHESSLEIPAKLPPLPSSPNGFEFSNAQSAPKGGPPGAKKAAA